MRDEAEDDEKCTRKIKANPATNREASEHNAVQCSRAEHNTQHPRSQRHWQQQLGLQSTHPLRSVPRHSGITLLLCQPTSRSRSLADTLFLPTEYCCFTMTKLSMIASALAVLSVSMSVATAFTVPQTSLVAQKTFPSALFTSSENDNMIETSFGAEAVPEGQRPVNEYLDLTRAPLFDWASEETGTK